VRRLALLLPLLFFAVMGGAHAQEHKEREFQECTDCPVMVGIPAGSFTMGSSAGEVGHFDNEGPQHAVAIRAFALAKFDVTAAQFLTFLEATHYKPAACNATLDLRIAWGAFYALAFIPLTYWIDRTAHRTYVRRVAKQAEKKT